MIYLQRIPRVLAMLAIACPLLAIGSAVFLISIIYAGFTSDTWNEAIDRTRTEREISR